MELIELFVLIETQSLKFSSLILNFGVEFWNLDVILSRLSGSLTWKNTKNSTLFCDSFARE